MNYISKHLTVAAILLSAICATAQDAAPAAPQTDPAATALANAQKSYVSGNWKEAATAYEKACPQQPKEKQAECLLWNVLALSQTGDAASFKKAGKRLDSLIQKVNPQESLYADLMMTSAQFRLYLGKYDLAAQDLIHAIETSKPHHNVVLQKVCTAVKAKTNNENLNERCELLKNPDSLANMQKSASAPVQQEAPKTEPATTVAEPPKAEDVKNDNKDVAKPEQPKTEPEVAVSTQAAEQPKEQPVAEPVAPAPVVEPVPAKPAEAAPVVEYWVLQLGAFSVKDNATLLASTLKKRKIQADIVEQTRGDKTLYLVQTGRFDTREAAVDFGAKQLAPLKVEFQPLIRK